MLCFFNNRTTCETLKQTFSNDTRYKISSIIRIKNKKIKKLNNQRN